MSESQTHYQSLRSVTPARTGAHMKTFFTVNGSTDVTNAVTAKVKGKGQIEVTSSDQCDYILAFCVISTSAGIDIQETKDKCPAGKPVILVLLHHTFDPEKSVFPGPGVTFWDSILLTVDLLFYEGRLLDCPHNEQELQKVLDVFGRASSKDFTGSDASSDASVTPGRTGAHMKTFFTVNGSTDVTNAVTAKVKSKGQIEVTSSDQCDYILAFCVIRTRAGIDIQETKDKCPAGKPVILVLLHDTFDPEKSVFPGPGVTFWDSIFLTVDLLFYEGRLLDCPHNKQELQKVLDVF